MQYPNLIFITIPSYINLSSLIDNKSFECSFVLESAYYTLHSAHRVLHLSIKCHNAKLAIKRYLLSAKIVIGIICLAIIEW